jgi:hypothetical protein
MKGTFITTVALLTTLVASAQAAQWPARPTPAIHQTGNARFHARVLQLPALQRAEQAAIAYWGFSPCNGNVSVNYAPAPPLSSLETGVVPPASYHAEAWAPLNGCSITFDSNTWNPGTEKISYPQFCAGMVHEYGHLQGLGHPDLATDSPTSITYPLLTALNEHVWSC